MGVREDQVAATTTRIAFKIARDYARLDLRDLNGTWPNYLQAVGYSMSTEWNVSTSDALMYLFNQLLLANNPPGEPLKRPTLNARVVRDMAYSTGPGFIRDLLNAGWQGEDAYASARTRSVLMGQNYIRQQGERAMQQAAALAVGTDGVQVLQGYRRIARPTACAFCRMIAGATAPPVPGTQAFQEGRAAKVGLVYNVTERWRHPHPNCKCRIEPQPVYKVRHVPSAAEKALTDRLYAELLAENRAAHAEAQRDLLRAA